MPNITFIIFLTYWKTFTKFNCLQSNIVSLGLYFRFEPFLPSLLLFPPFTFYWSYTECFLVSSHLSSSLAGNASNLLCRNTVMPPELSSSLWLTLPRISSPSLPFSGHFHFAPTVLHCWKVGSFKEGKDSISFIFTWYTEITKVLKDQLCFFFWNLGQGEDYWYEIPPMKLLSLWILGIYQGQTLSATQTMKTPMFPKPLINITIISKKLIHLVSHITLYIIYQVKQHTFNSTTDNVPFHIGVLS